MNDEEFRNDFYDESSEKILGEKKLPPPNCLSNLCIILSHKKQQYQLHKNKEFQKLDMDVSKFLFHLIHSLSVTC